MMQAAFSPKSQISSQQAVNKQNRRQDQELSKSRDAPCPQKMVREMDLLHSPVVFPSLIQKNQSQGKQVSRNQANSNQQRSRIRPGVSDGTSEVQQNRNNQCKPRKSKERYTKSKKVSHSKSGEREEMRVNYTRLTQQLLQFLLGGHRCLAGIVLTDIGRRLAVHRFHGRQSFVAPT